MFQSQSFGPLLYICTILNSDCYNSKITVQIETIVTAIFLKLKPWSGVMSKYYQLTPNVLTGLKLDCHKCKTTKKIKEACELFNRNRDKRLAYVWHSLMILFSCGVAFAFDLAMSASKSVINSKNTRGFKIIKSINRIPAEIKQNPMAPWVTMTAVSSTVAACHNCMKNIQLFFERKIKKNYLQNSKSTE